MICFYKIKKQINTHKVQQHNMFQPIVSKTLFRNANSKIVCPYVRVSLVFCGGADRVFKKTKKTKKQKR